MDTPKYQRVLLKLSGEGLLGELTFGIDPNVVHTLGKALQEVVELGVSVGLVIGAGNFFRGANLVDSGLDRATGDSMGMLATHINALALADLWRKQGLDCAVFGAQAVSGLVKQFEPHTVDMALSSGKIIIFSGGTGHPFFTTDTAAVLRGLEINADVILKATQVDGVYSADPKLSPGAKLYTHLSFREAISKQLKIMDLTAMALCSAHNMPLRVFNMSKSHVLKNVILGQAEGTLVENKAC